MAFKVRTLAQWQRMSSTEATAVIDLRLKAGNDADRQVNKLIATCRAGAIPYWTTSLPIPNVNGFRSSQRSPNEGGYNAQRRLWICIAPVANHGAAVDYPSSGFHQQEEASRYFYTSSCCTQPITIPVVNYDNNQHAENEKHHAEIPVGRN